MVKMKITSVGDDVRVMMDMYIKEHPDEKLFIAHGADTEGNIEYDGCVIITNIVYRPPS